MARITFRQDVVEALRETADRLGLSMEETVNNAVLVYRDMVLHEQQTGADSTFDDAFSSFMCSTEIGKEMRRRDRQRDIQDEKRDIKFHRKHNRPYTPIK